jgi:hypothetical protein
MGDSRSRGADWLLLAIIAWATLANFAVVIAMATLAGWVWFGGR